MRRSHCNSSDFVTLKIPLAFGDSAAPCTMSLIACNSMWGLAPDGSAGATSSFPLPRRLFVTPVHGTAGEDDSPYTESSEQKLTTVRERFREREREKREVTGREHGGSSHYLNSHEKKQSTVLSWPRWLQPPETLLRRGASLNIPQFFFFFFFVSKAPPVVMLVLNLEARGPECWHTDSMERRHRPWCVSGCVCFHVCGQRTVRKREVGSLVLEVWHVWQFIIK